MSDGTTHPRTFASRRVTSSNPGRSRTRSRAWTPPTTLLLLALWDVCYRIGTGWWTSVIALWRSLTGTFDPETTRALRRTDLETTGFGLVQLLPFVLDRPVLVAVLGGHVLAAVVVSSTAAGTLRTTPT